jgi:hypothetical protein
MSRFPPSSSHPNPTPPFAPLMRTIPLPPENNPALVHTRHSHRLNRLIALHAEECLTYDFSFPTSVTITPQSSRYNWLRSEAATNPRCSYLRVNCPQLSQSFVISPESPNPGAFVSVLCVLQGIHRSLRRNVEQGEYSLLSLDVRRRIEGARYRRCTRIINPGARVDEYQNVMKVDLLMGIHNFVGLSNTNDANILQLHLSSHS